MRILGMNRINEIYKSQTRKVEQTKIAQKDEVQLSTQAKDYQYAFKALKEVPDVRQDKVDSIKEAINSGTYNVNATQVCEKIMSHFDRKG